MTKPSCPAPQALRRCIINCDIYRVGLPRKQPTNTIHAIYENGVFRPLAPVDLPERTNVQIVVPASAGTEPLQRILDMVEQGAAELDRGDVVDADSVFAELAARRTQLQAAPTTTQNN